LAANAAKRLVDPNKYNATFFFGPIMSGMLEVVANITEQNQKILMSSRSNFYTIWNGAFNYSFGMLYTWPPKNPFLDTFNLYQEKGAKKIGIICDSTVYSTGTAFFYNYCMHVSNETFTAEIQPYDMTVVINISVASGLDSTYNNLREAVRKISQSDIDVLIISTGVGMSYPPVLGATAVSYIKDIIYFMKDFKVNFCINPFLK
jgi:hypothetical protein